MTFTKEQMNKAKSAKSADELLALAKESGIEMTADEAAKYFAELHKEGELTDSELASVAGGKGEPEPKYARNSNVVCYDNWSDNWKIIGMEYKEGEWWYTLDFNGRIIKRPEWQIIGYR